MQTSITEPSVAQKVNRLLFGVDSKHPANDLLQNNIEQFEWVVRNKIYPNFYGRNMVGEKCLTREEIKFLHIHLFLLLCIVRAKLLQGACLAFRCSC